MRYGLSGLMGLFCVVAVAMAQPPGQGEFNQGAPGVGDRGPGGPGPLMGPPRNLMFEAIDADGDGVITTRELRRAVAALKKLDADGDGNITLAEVSVQGGPFGDPAQFVERMMQNDRNGDGKLTADELPGPMGEQMLQANDTNGDGALDRDELAAAMENMRNRFGQGGAGPGGPGGNFPMGPGQFQGGGNFDAQQMTGRFLQFDRNGDGQLTADELPQQAVEALQGADLNGDGVVDAAELRAHVERNRERLRGGFGRGPRGGAGPDGMPAGPRGNR